MYPRPKLVSTERVGLYNRCEMATLYVVATPIGNLEDITLRALRVLGEVALIAAEDTRVTRRLLSRYNISTPLTSYHEHNERQKLESILGRLRDGDAVALVSDAGARITSTLDLPEVLQEVVDAACRLTDAQYGALAVFETNPAPCASSSRTASLSRYKNVLASFRRAWACSGGFRRPRNH